MNRKSILSSAIAACLMLIVVAAASAQSGRNRRPAPAPQPAAPQPAAAPVEPAPAPRSAPVPYVANFKVKYAGGSLGLKDDADVRVDIRDGRITFTADKLDVTVVGDRVTDVSYGQRVRKRVEGRERSLLRKTGSL